MEHIFGDGGLLSQHLNGYTPRPSQVELASRVEEAIRTGTHLLAEAPTGTGKSMAYGIPAALEALKSGRSVVIATANITLQEQLFRKDVPLIAEMLSGYEDPAAEDDVFNGIFGDLEFKLIKGMNNYLCLDKFAELETEGFSEDWFEEITQWANRTATGDKSELMTELPADQWRMVSSSSDDCSKSDCPFYDQCYALRGRRAEDGELIITNYHMLFTDFMVRAMTSGKVQLLPNYDILIMDEAHEAADIAMSFQGFELTNAKISSLAKRLNRMGTTARSFADSLKSTSSKFFDNANRRFTYDILQEPLSSRQSKSLVAAFDNAMEFIKDELREHKEKDSTRRKGVEEDGKKSLAVRRLEALQRSMASVRYQVKVITEGIFDEEDQRYCLPEGMVFFMEKDNKYGLKLCSKSVDVDQFFRETVFKDKTVVAVSATLATRDSFDFIAQGFGLGSGEYTECMVDSPFDASRMLLVVPEEVPVPKKAEEHRIAVARVVERVVNDIGGRTMALYTSYKSLNTTHDYLRRRLQDYEILVQGKMPKSRIIERFMANPQSVILGTSSFWQGVDIPGQSLSCVIIDKFPFMPPSDPVLKYLETKNGKSAFFDYSVPKAVIALKQGIGRLIRRETDYGVVVLCDNRIDTTGYGKSNFATAFPPGACRSEDDSLDDVRSFLRWMEKQSGQKAQRSS